MTTMDGAQSSARLSGLDGLRGAACIGVVIAHVSGATAESLAQHLLLGWTGSGVYLFFALSGFLLYLPMVKRVSAEQPDSFDIAGFVRHRVLRVFPAFLVIFAIASGVGAVYLQNPAELSDSLSDGVGRITDPGLLAANLTLVNSYLPEMFQTGINPSWTLTVELAFYTSLVAVGASAVALRRRSRLTALQVSLVFPTILLSIGLVTKICLAMTAVLDPADPYRTYWGATWLAVVEHSFPAQADTFAAGMFAAVVFSRRSAVPRYLGVLCGLGCLVAIGAALVVDPFSPFRGTALAAASGLIILGFVTARRGGVWQRISRVCSTGPLDFVGTISLSIYLWHYPILILADRWGWTGGDSILGLCQSLVVVLGLSVLLSTATFYGVEQPAMRFARRRSRRRAEMSRPELSTTS